MPLESIEEKEKLEELKEQLKQLKKQIKDNFLYQALALNKDFLKKNLDIYAGVSAVINIYKSNNESKDSQMYLNLLSKVVPYDDPVYQKGLLERFDSQLSPEEKIMIISGAYGSFVDYLLFPPSKNGELVESLEEKVLADDFINTCKEMLGKLFGIKNESIIDKQRINSIFEKVRTLLIKKENVYDLNDILSYFIKNPTPIEKSTGLDKQEEVTENRELESAGQSSEQRNFPDVFLDFFLTEDGFFIDYLVGEGKTFASQLEFFTKFHEHCLALEQLKDQENEDLNDENLKDENLKDDMLYAIGSFIAEYSPQTLTQKTFWENLKSKITEKEWTISDGFINKIHNFLKASTHKSNKIGFYFLLFIHWVQEKVGKKKKWSDGIEIETGNRSTQVLPEPSTSQSSNTEPSLSRASSINDKLFQGNNTDSEQSPDLVPIKVTKKAFQQAKKEAKKLVKQSMTQGNSFTQKLSVDQRQEAILAEICFLTGKMPLLMEHLLKDKAEQNLTALAMEVKVQMGENLKGKNNKRVTALREALDNFALNLTERVQRQKKLFLSWSSPSPNQPTGKVSPGA